MYQIVCTFVIHDQVYFLDIVFGMCTIDEMQTSLQMADQFKWPH